MRDKYIEMEILTYLAELNPPRSFTEQVQKAEIERIVSNLIGLSPDENYETWINEVINELREKAENRTWPLLKSFIDAARITNLKNSRHSRGKLEPFKIDEWQLTASRIKQGEPIGTRWLEEEKIKMLLERGLVTEEDVEQYGTRFRRA